MPPRRRKKKADAAGPTTPAPLRVLAVPEIVGHVYDYLDVDQICSACAVSKSLDKATAFVTHVVVDYCYDAMHYDWVWLRFQQAHKVEMHSYATECELSKLSAALSLAGSSWRHLELHLYGDGDESEDEENSYSPLILRLVKHLRIAIGRGALPNIEYFFMRIHPHDDTGNCVTLGANDPLYSHLAGLADVLPPFARACMAIEFLGAEYLEKILDAHPELDVNETRPFDDISLLAEWAQNEYFEDEETETAIFRALLARGADPNRLLPSGDNICTRCQMTRQLQLLVDEGVHVNRGRIKPLLLACGAGFSRCHYKVDPGGWRRGTVDGVFLPKSSKVDVLLAAGADPLVRYAGKGVHEIIGDRLDDANDALAQNPESESIRANIRELEKISVAVGRAIEQIARRREHAHK